MKKSIVFLAAAALTLGMISCTEELVDPEEIVNGTEIVDNPVTSVRVKSTADLVGTEWNYTMQDMAAIDPFSGDTTVIDMSDMTFTLTFGEEYAQIALPEDMVMLSLADDYTVEEIAAMQFAFEYDQPTTSGTLTAVFNDITAEPVNLQINFTYNEATDVITLDLPISMDPTATTGMQIDFQRI